MPLPKDVPLEKLTPARLWTGMDAETRRLAAECLYRPGWDDAGARAEADAAIATALRFRPESVRRLPVPKRIGYLVNVVRPGESLATALLRALHIGRRPEMLGAFLDRLGIRHEDGVIESDDPLDPPDAEAIESAADELRRDYPEDDVELYLATLLAMDPEFWVNVSGVLVPPADR